MLSMLLHFLAMNSPEDFTLLRVELSFGPLCVQHSEIKMVRWRVKLSSETGATVYVCVTAVWDRNKI